MNAATIYTLPVGLSLAQLGTYRVHIPGIREDQPKLFVGDRMLFRGLYPDIQAPSNAEVDAEVVGMQKGAGMVFVRSPQLAELHYSLPKVSIPGWEGPAPAVYQIRFLASAHAVCVMQDAVSLYGFECRTVLTPGADSHFISKDLVRYRPTLAVPRGAGRT